jgi:hypothetical protein
MSDQVAQLRERLVTRATLGRQRVGKLLHDPEFDASREAAEAFIDDLYDYVAARLRSEEEK